MMKVILTIILISLQLGCNKNDSSESSKDNRSSTIKIEKDKRSNTGTGNSYDNSYNDEREDENSENIVENPETDDEYTQDDDNFYHRDSRYKYNYRKGYSNNYEYNYDIEGYDDNGNYVSGNINTNGKYGSGYIIDENGNEIEVETEWYDYGKMEATDHEGNNYDLEVNE